MVSEAKKAANKRWDDAHREKKRYIVAKSAAKRFITKLGTKEDLEELSKLLKEKLDGFE